MNGLYGTHSVGEKINNKTLLSYAGKNKYGHHQWNWSCDLCDSTGGPSSISHLRRSQQCMKKCMSGETNPRWKGHKELTGVFLYQYRSDAQKKNREWSVAPEYLWSLWEKQGGLCALTGWTLIHGESASIDRIDSSQGYVEGNVQWVHRDINRIKSDFSQDRFVELCSAVSDYTAVT